jgi:pyruvate kinase
MTQIITTIGPVSEDEATLTYFSEHKVGITRLNFSHNTADWHIKTGLLAKKIGLETMADLAGPKVLIGDLGHEVEIDSWATIFLEKQIAGKQYPAWQEYEDRKTLVLPTYFDLTPYASSGKMILIDDGKVELKVREVKSGQVICQVIYGGMVKSHKGINLPGTELSIDFLVERDRMLLDEVIPAILPDWIAPSFVQSLQDLHQLDEFVEQIKTKYKLDPSYKPKICTKLEMAKAVESDTLEKIVDYSDMVMVARGDLALETLPIHVMVPVIQDRIVEVCKAKNKPFIVATQILEGMFSSPVPTRAEVSDLYRAIHIQGADYVMLSGETAAGKYARRCVELMEKMIELK